MTGARNPAVGGHPDPVLTLFERKAPGWPGKYAADGRLTGRLAQFVNAVHGLVPAGSELLDLGCGSGELARRLAADGYQVAGCDIAPQMLGRAAEADLARAVRWVGLEPGWRALPFPGASLDVVVAASVLEYVRVPGEVLRECARVLRPGGILLVTVPNVAHPVRWLEWPLRLAARTPLATNARSDPRRAGQYLAYLWVSRQRHRMRWWHATARRAGLEPVRLPPAARQPLRLLAFARTGSAAGHQFDSGGVPQ